MERLKGIKDILEDIICEQIKHPKDVNTKELGEVIDMIKDIEQAEYYHTKEMLAYKELGEPSPYDETHKEHHDEAHKEHLIESKEVHKKMTIEELMNELTEMAENQSAENKIIMQQKLSILMNKLK